jgi:hypothetical protein
MDKKYFIRQISADEAFRRLNRLFELFTGHTKKQLSDEQKAYCEEWLFDCVHDTGYCSISLPLEIFNASFDEFKEEN